MALLERTKHLSLHANLCRNLRRLQLETKEIRDITSIEEMEHREKKHKTMRRVVIMCIRLSSI